MLQSNDRLMMIAAGTLLGTAGLLWATLALGSRHYRSIQSAQALQRTERLREQTLERGELWVPRHAGSRLPMDPLDAGWESAPPVEIPLVAQAITMPILEQATVTRAGLRGLTDGRDIVWRVDWADPTASTRLDSGVFSDAVALQFPLVDDASFMMGERGKRVQILQWKGIWQFDVDEHYQDVQDLHPNFWTDLYWFAEGEFPFPVAEAFEQPESRTWFPAYRAGNPQSDFHRRQPVDELMAEGYGSLTPHTESATRGRGVWADGRWAVTFVRPLHTDDPLDAQFQAGGIGNVGVAVWEGSAGNVGARKHWSNWVAFRVQS